MAATRSFEDTCRVLHHRYPAGKRALAWYQPRNLMRRRY
jgi:hypothetical protein